FCSGFKLIGALAQLTPWSVQKPLMQRFVVSQQSAAVVHFSCGLEQFVFGLLFAHTRLLFASGSQKPLQHWSPDSQPCPSSLQGSSTQNPRAFPARSSCPGK